jgi:putative peptidoglycan binding protein
MRDGGRAADKSDRGERQTIGQGRGDRDKARQSESESDRRGQKDQTVGQGREDRDKARQSQSESDKRGRKDQTIGQGRSDRDKTRQSEDTKQDKNTTTGANTRDNARDNAQGKNAQGQSSTTTGANTKSNTAPGQTTGANTRDQTNTQTQGQANAPAPNQNTTAQSMSGRVSVTAQQQTRLQQSVLSSRDVSRVRVNANSINFRINAGVVVPRNYAVLSISAYPALYDIYPDYRDDSFFVVDDEIVVLDRSRRIVDVVPAGPRARYARSGGGASSGGASVAALDLSPAEIRIVQQVLIDDGLLRGEADGILGPSTREALITYQRQQGLQVTGSIDTRTVAALGVSNKISATQGQSSTTVGQGRGGQQPSAQQNNAGQTTGQSNAPAQQNQQGTTGQAGNQNQPANQTTGQAGNQRPSDQTTGQAPAQGGNQPNASSNPPSGQTNQNNAPASSGTSQPAQNPPSR